MKEKIAKHVFRSMIGVLFGYFGILALSDPRGQAAAWISPDIASIIGFFIPVGVFMLVLGTLQVAVALSLIANKFVHIALPLAAALLAGIIINLGWDEIALRDFVILTGIVYLYLQTKSRPA